MSQGSYSFARTLSAKRARQDVREYTRGFATGTIPLMAERAVQAPREKSLWVETLPVFENAIAYVNGLPVLAPAYAAHSYRCIPGVRARKLHVIEYGVQSV